MRGLAKYTHRSPDSLSHEDLRGYFQYLVTERHLAPASVRLSYNGIRFLYLQVLDWNTLDLIAQLASTRASDGAPQHA